MEAKPEACRQVPAQESRDEFGGFARERSALEKNARGGERERPYGDDRRDQHREHPRKSAPDFLIQFWDAPFLDKSRHVGVTRDTHGKSENGDERVHDAVGIIEARDAGGSEVAAEAADDEIEGEHASYAEGHGNHHA